MRRWLIAILGTLVALVAILFGYGVSLPRDHVARSRITLRQPAESAWAVMRNVGGITAWWPSATVVTPVAGGDGQERWREEVDGFTMQVRVEELVPGRSFRTVIESRPDDDFGGTWTYDVESDGDVARVTVTEAGWVANPLFRALSRLGGQHATLDSYLTALGRRFRQDVRPEHLERGP